MRAAFRKPKEPQADCTDDQYTNVPDVLKEEMPDMLAKGSFREISLTIDGMNAGYAFPYPVIFSGGIVPSAWRPMIAYGAYDQPTYHIDITPLLPLFAGRAVRFALIVHGQGDGKKRNTYGNWFISGNVKVWRGDKPMSGRLLEYHNPALEESSVIHIEEENGTASVVTTAKRHFKLVSELNGRRVTFEQYLHFLNRQNLSSKGGKQRVEQLIRTEMEARDSGKTTFKDNFSFPLLVESDYSAHNHFSASIQLGYHRQSILDKTDVVQTASGSVSLNEIGRVVNGTGKSHGRISHQDFSGRAYEREVQTKGIRVLKDDERESRYAF